MNGKWNDLLNPFYLHYNKKKELKKKFSNCFVWWYIKTDLGWVMRYWNSIFISLFKQLGDYKKEKEQANDPSKRITHPLKRWLDIVVVQVVRLMTSLWKSSLDNGLVFVCYYWCMQWSELFKRQARKVDFVIMFNWTHTHMHT